MIFCLWKHKANIYLISHYVTLLPLSILCNSFSLSLPLFFFFFVTFLCIDLSSAVFQWSSHSSLGFTLSLRVFNHLQPMTLAPNYLLSIPVTFGWPTMIAHLDYSSILQLILLPYPALISFHNSLHGSQDFHLKTINLIRINTCLKYSYRFSWY